MPYKKKKRDGPSAREREHRHVRVVIEASIPYVRGRNNRKGNALRRGILQLSVAGEGSTKHSQDVFPRVGRADADVVPRVRARVGVRAAQDARKDALIEVDEVVQAYLERRDG
jgi:hypothetical protein